MKIISVELIGLCFLLVISVCIREIFWFKEVKDLKNQKKITSTIRLTEPPKVTASQCIISVRGIEYRTFMSQCMSGGMIKSSAGERLEISGNVKSFLIMGKQQEKSFIYVTKYRLLPGNDDGRFGEWQLLRRVYKLRMRLLEVYKRNLPEPEASLVAGVVYGEQSELPEELEDSLKKAGLMHVVAASGYNVTVVAGLIMVSLAKWLGRRWSALVAIMGVAVYVILAGASPPIIRSGLMGIVALLALYLGRTYWGLWVLGVSSAIMLLLWPWLLVSLSFQLSVAATLGMMVWVRPVSMMVDRLMKYLTHIDLMRSKTIVWLIFGYIKILMIETFATTVAAIIATTPLQLMYFGETSWLGLIANPLLLWVIPLLMYLGLAGSILGLVWNELGGVFMWSTYPVAHLFISILSLINKIPFGIYMVNGNWLINIGWWIGWWGWSRWIMKKRIADS